jgi:hypothetical protein
MIEQNKLSEQEIQAYFNDIENAKALFTKTLKEHKHPFRDEMKTYKRYYAGFFTADEVGSETGVILNEFNTNVSVLKPNLYFANPYVSVIPMEDKFDITKIGGEVQEVSAKDQARNAEFVLNYISQIELDDEKTMNECIDDTLVVGFAVHKSGWIYEEDTNLNEVKHGSEKPLEERVNEQNTEALLALKEQAGDAIPGEEVVNEIPKTKKDMLFSGRVSPFNILIDPECNDWEDLSSARYMVEIHRINTEYANKLFNVKLTGSSTSAFTGDVDMDNDIVSLNLKQSIIYELWDKKNNRVVYLSPELPKEPLEMKQWWKNEEYPYEFLMFFKNNDKQLPIAWFRLWKDLVFEKMRLRSKMSDLMKRIYQTFLADDTISGKLDEILNGKGGTVVPVKRNNQESLEGFVKMIADFTLNPTYFNYNELINSDLDRHSGVNDMLRGMISESKRTAHELMQIGNNQNIKIDVMQKRIKKFLLNIYRKRLILLQNNQVLKKRLFHNFPKAGNVDMKWNMDEIQGKFYFDMDISSMVKKNKEVLRTQTMEKYQLLGADPMENHEMLLQDVHEMFNDANVADRILKPQPPAPKKPDLKISLSLKGEDLLNPEVKELITSYGVDIVTEQPQTPTGSVGGNPTSIPQNNLRSFTNPMNNDSNTKEVEAVRESNRI